MYEKAICLKISRSAAVMFTDRELKTVGKLHMTELLLSNELIVDNITRYDIVIDRDNKENDNATMINVRSYRECDCQW